MEEGRFVWMEIPTLILRRDCYKLKIWKSMQSMDCLQKQTYTPTLLEGGIIMD